MYVETVRILVALSQAGSASEIGPALRREGIALDKNETLFDLLDAVSEHLDTTRRTKPGASDIGELARRALLATLHERLIERMPGLFAEQSGDLANAVSYFAGPAGFSDLSRSFFTRMTSGTLAYWLERTLSSRIEDLESRDAFDAALMQYSAEATRITREFSSGWFAKNALGRETTPSQATRAFAAIAFKKINDELRRKTGLNA